MQIANLYYTRAVGKLKPYISALCGKSMNFLNSFAHSFCQSHLTLPLPKMFNKVIPQSIMCTMTFQVTNYSQVVIPRHLSSLFAHSKHEPLPKIIHELPLCHLQLFIILWRMTHVMRILVIFVNAMILLVVSQFPI